MLFLCLGFALFGWLSAVYIVFHACTVSFIKGTVDNNNMKDLTVREGLGDNHFIINRFYRCRVISPRTHAVLII